MRLPTMVLLAVVFTFALQAAPAIEDWGFYEGAYKWVPITEKPQEFYTLKQKVYPGGKSDPHPIKGADAPTFTIAQREGTEPRSTSWGRDKNHIYLGSKVLKEADRETFVVVNDSIAKDKNHVYCTASTFDSPTSILEGADPKTFERMASPGDKTNSKFWYYRDAKSVYSKWCRLIASADRNTFEMIQNPIPELDARDKERRYGLGQLNDR